MPRPVKWFEMGQTVVPFTVHVRGGRGCPDSELSLGSEGDVNVVSQRCADSGCCAVSASMEPKY